MEDSGGGCLEITNGEQHNNSTHTQVNIETRIEYVDCRYRLTAPVYMSAFAGRLCV